MSTPPKAARLGQPLTRTELVVLERVAAGRRNDGTAADLWLSVDTVKSHVQHMFRKLGATDRAHLVALAFAAGYLSVTGDGRIITARPDSRRTAA